jgi:tetratricopeptide (TPR) repeat protein
MKCRYAVHSLVQRNIFQRLGAPLIEFPHADQFTVTIYAAQPNDLPRLSLKVHQDLGRTVAALSGYDNDQGDGEDYNLLIKQDIGNKYLQQRMLRAAFALLRSIYSLPVIARFQVPPDDGTSKGEPVAASPRFLEEHRRLIRWVLRQAVKLENGDASQQQVKPGSGERSEQTCALHKEEIVWLFNEAGVLSLVQGRLHDARALFDRALAAADRIERNEHGALHTRILLNRALVDIERGRAGRTIGTLRRIAGSKDVEHPVLPLLAAGYLGLVHHFNGDVKAAMDRYEEVIGPLQQHRQYRSASIFVRHMADLLRVADNPDFVKSRTCVEQAIRFAMDGGHEDMRHQGLLSSARIDIAEIEAGSKRAVAASAVQAKLVVVERYARTIDIPRMLCDVAHFRALLHCHGGNLTTAGLLVSDALEIAARNGLRVKKIALLILLARINAERGYAAISLPLLNHAVRIAQSAKCHFELGRAQNLINELSLGGHRIKIAG